MTSTDNSLSSTSPNEPSTNNISSGTTTKPSTITGTGNRPLCRLNTLSLTGKENDSTVAVSVSVPLTVVLTLIIVTALFVLRRWSLRSKRKFDKRNLVTESAKHSSLPKTDIGYAAFHFICAEQNQMSASQDNIHSRGLSDPIKPDEIPGAVCKSDISINNSTLDMDCYSHIHQKPKHVADETYSHLSSTGDCNNGSNDEEYSHTWKKQMKVKAAIDSRKGGDVYNVLCSVPKTNEANECSPYNNIMVGRDDLYNSVEDDYIYL